MNTPDSPHHHPSLTGPPDAAGRPASLGAAARALGGHAALLADGFSLADLQAVGGSPPAAFAQALAELCAQGVLQVEANGYRFADAGDREALLAALPEADRRRAHTAVGRWLESRAPEAPSAAHWETLAEHFLAGDDPEPAVHAALRAGLALTESGEHAAAERRLEAGFARLKLEGRAAWRRLRLDYLAALGDLWRHTGRLADARAAYDEALQLAEALNEPRLTGPMLTSLAQVLQGLDAWDEAERLADRAVKACLAVNDASGAARALLTAARLRVHAGRLTDAHIQVQRALAIARDAGDGPRLADALGLMGYLHIASHPKRLQEGVDCLHESIAIASAHEDRGGLLLGHMLLGNAQLAMGDYGGSARAFAIARWIAQDTGNRSEEGIALINLALAALELGRLQEALTEAVAARRHAEALDNRYQLGLALGVEALAHAHLGQLAEAHAALSQAEAMASAPENPYMATLVWQWAQEARLLLGDAAGALRAGEALGKLTIETGNAEAESRTNALLAETLGRLGDRPAAMRAAQMALASAEAARAQGDQVRALRVIAWLMAEDGDRAGARRFADMACTIARGLGGAYQAALLERLQGEWLRRDDPPGARAHFEAMRALADEMACPPLQALALAELGRGAAARAQLSAMLNGADATIRQQFLQIPEFARILAARGTGPLEAPESELS